MHAPGDGGGAEQTVGAADDGVSPRARSLNMATTSAVMAAFNGRVSEGLDGMAQCQMGCGVVAAMQADDALLIPG